MNYDLMLTYDTPAYMFNVYKNQLSRQTGSRNLTGPKMLPTIWHTYMKLVTKYQISAINSCWEKCDEKYLGTDGRTKGRTKVKQYTRWSGGINIKYTRFSTIHVYHEKEEMFPIPLKKSTYSKIYTSHSIHDNKDVGISESTKAEV